MSLGGLQLGHFRLLHLLGTGGMGEVYLAEDMRITRQVAIKVIKSDGMPYPGTLNREDANRLFLREARAITALQHPYILQLFDYGEVAVEDGTLNYMVMPYCQESSLDTWLRQRGSYYIPSLDWISHILEQSADALQYAHDKQIIHQDVKLSNFLIHRWKASGIPDLLLADFGIAKFLSAYSRSSQSIRGTPTSMAPEQWEGHPVPATDQYALAVMIYQLLTGTPPFQGGPGQIMYQHLTVPPLPPSAKQPDVPSSIDVVLLKALKKQPQERFETILAFAEAFRQALPVVSDLAKITGVPQAGREKTAPSISKTSSRTPPTILSAIPPTISTTLEERRILGNQRMEHQYPRFTSGKGLLLALLILILMAGSVGVTFFLTRSSPSSTSSNTPTILSTPPNTNATDASTQVSVGETATVNVNTQIQNATATAQAAFQNPYPPHTGTLVLNDPLANNNEGNSWEEGTRDQGTCTFIRGAYQASIPLAGYFHSCLALSTNFSNFAFEVQMTLVSASGGGIVFRADRATTHLYYFTVDRNGGYLLKAYYDKVGDATVIARGSGLNFSATEYIGVVTQGNAISLYVNRQLVRTVYDSTFTQGQVGVVTYEGDATFNNATVWAL
ncbi:MAG TPA: serine/threonine-protein kinase [Ktedonobacteraceae bacterium]|nr:serine/threonine-protein kinase [Ktedonobacteraceae bacterium]